jgi:predicted  nucleic acid-binding Zn-ribbon protein
MELTEQRLKKILQEQRLEYQRHLDVVAEDFDSNMKLLGESVSGVQEQLVAIRDMVARNTENIEVIKTTLEIMSHQLKRKVDMDEFEALARRVLILERRRA